MTLESENTGFARKAELGLNRWWRWLLGLGLAIAAYLVGNLPLIAVMEARGTALGLTPEARAEAVAQEGLAALGLGGAFGLFLMLLAFVPVLIAVPLVVRALHRRPARSVFTARARFDWRRVAVGAGVWLAFTALGAFLLIPEDALRWSFEPARFWPFAAVVLLLIPLQVAAEEVLFRGYLLQGLMRVLRHPLAALVILTALFVAPHAANPEFAHDLTRILPVYAGLGLAFGALAIADDGLELPIGVHLGNNLFATLVVNASDGAVAGPALFETTVAETLAVLPAMTGVAALSLVALHLLYRPDWGRLFRRQGR